MTISLVWTFRRTVFRSRLSSKSSSRLVTIPTPSQRLSTTSPAKADQALLILWARASAPLQRKARRILLACWCLRRMQAWRCPRFHLRMIRAHSTLYLTSITCQPSKMTQSLVSIIKALSFRSMKKARRPPRLRQPMRHPILKGLAKKANS